MFAEGVIPSGIQAQACAAALSTPVSCAMGLPNTCELVLEVGITPACVFSNKIIPLPLILLFWSINTLRESFQLTQKYRVNSRQGASVGVP